MKYRMIFVDRWTLLMIVVLAIEVLLAVFAAKKEDDETRSRNKNAAAQ
jgi:hypothetical protein